MVVDIRLIGKMSLWVLEALQCTTYHSRMGMSRAKTEAMKSARLPGNMELV